MGVPIKYRKSREREIRYSFTDIATGNVVQQLKLAMISGASVFSPNQSGASGVLSQADRYSHEVIKTHIENGADTDKQILHLNFDLPIERPLIIQGDTYVSLSTGMKQNSGSTAQGSIRFKPILKQIRKFKENIIKEGEFSGYGVKRDALRAPIAGDHEDILATKFNIPKTTYTKGDILRLTIEVYITITGTTQWQISIGLDPKNRTDPNSIIGTNDTISEFYLPIKTDI